MKKTLEDKDKTLRAIIDGIKKLIVGKSNNPSLLSLLGMVNLDEYNSKDKRKLKKIIGYAIKQINYNDALNIVRDLEQTEKKRLNALEKFLNEYGKI